MPMASRFTRLTARHSFAMSIPACEREASANSPLHVLCDDGPFWKIDHGDQLCRTFGAAKYHPLLLFLVLLSRTPTPAAIFWVRFAKIDDDRPDLSSDFFVSFLLARPNGVGQPTRAMTG